MTNATGVPVRAGVAVYTVVNDSRVTRHRMRFAAAVCTHETASGARLVCRDGSPITCP